MQPGPESEAKAEAVESAPDTVGAQLRRAREARGESLSDAALALRLSRRQVEALEGGDYSALPGPAFVRGFLRNYARHLGLDAAALLAGAGMDSVAAIDLAPVSNAHGDLPGGGGARRGVKPVVAVVVLLLLVALGGGYFDWFQVRPPVVTDANEGGGASGQEESAAGSDAPSSVAPEPLTVPEPAGASSGADQSPVVDVPGAAGAAQAGNAGQNAALEFAFTGDAWIEVRDATGNIVYSGTGKPGSHRSVQGTAPFSMVIGNARDVRLEYGGQPVDLVPHTRGSVARLTMP